MKLIYKKYFLYLLFIYSVFIFIIYLSGYFQIGMLSDSYEDAYHSVTSGFLDMFTDNIYEFRFRPLLFITLQILIKLAALFNFAYDNFLLYSFFNLFLYLVFAFVSGLTILYLFNDIKKSLFLVSIILIFPNNLHNLCWSAAFFELLCGIFYVSSILFSIFFLNSGRKFSAVMSMIFLILGLMTKEITITLPLSVFLIGYLIYSKERFKNLKIITILQFLILSLYFVFRILIVPSIPFSRLNTSVSNPLSTTADVILKGIISLLIPVDYLLIKSKLMNFDIPFLIYLICLMIFLIYFIGGLIKFKSYAKIILIIILFLLVISPYIIAGYMRPQLIIIPFSIMMITIFIIFDKYTNLIRTSVKTSIIIILLFWLYYGIQTINGWSQASTISKNRMGILQKTEFSSTKKPLIIGNLSRINQFFMFDNLLYSYNYWKYGGFVLKDTILQEIRTIALNFDDLNSEIKYSKLNEKEYIISTGGDYQFFNVGEYLKPEINDVFSTSILQVSVLENNLFGKTTKLKFKILTDDVEIFLFNGNELIKL